MESRDKPEENPGVCSRRSTVPSSDTKLTSNPNELYEQLQRKLADDKCEDAMFLLLNAANAWVPLVPRVLDLMNERRTQKPTGSNINGDYRSQEPEQDVQNNPGQVQDTLDRTSDDHRANSSAMNVYYDKVNDRLIITKGIVDSDKIDPKDTTHGVTIDDTFFGHLKQACTALAARNTDDAKKNIQIVNGLRNVVSVVKIKQREDENENNIEASSFENPIDQENARLCLETAEKAYDSKDFIKAHKFLLKAKNIDPNNKKVQEMLKDVEVILSYKKKWLDDHINNAEEAMRRKDYKDAGKILLDALSIDPTSGVIKDMLKEVKDDIEETRKASQSSSQIPEKYSQSAAAAKYIEIALDMMDKRWYYSAESWLKLANGTHETPTGTNLLASIEVPLEALSKKSTKEKELLKKIEAKHHLEEASKLFLNDKLDEATTFVIVAQNICNTFGKARDIMPMIFKKKFEVVTGKEATKFEGKNKYKFRNYNDADRYNKFMSDCYMEAVSVAAKMKDLQLVQEYLTKCNEMYYSVETKKMLLEVRADNADQSIFRKIITRYLSTK